MQNIQNTNKDFLDEHEQKLIKVLQSTDEQSGVSSALTTRIESVETKISSYDEKNKTLTENILVTNETQLKDFRNTFDIRIAELCKRSDQHSDQFDQAELKMVDLVKKMNENQHHITRDFEEIRKNISDDKSLLIIQLKEQSEKFESVYNSIDDKVELMETKFVTKMDHKAASLEKQIADLGLKLHDSINRSKEDLQSIRCCIIKLNKAFIKSHHKLDAVLLHLKLTD